MLGYWHMIHGHSDYDEKGKRSLSLRPQLGPIHHAQYHLLADGMNRIAEGADRQPGSKPRSSVPWFLLQLLHQAPALTHVYGGL